jgi:hypothetical protein
MPRSSKTVPKITCVVIPPAATTSTVSWMIIPTAGPFEPYAPNLRVCEVQR